MSARVAMTKPGPPAPGQLEIIGEKCLAFVRENATPGDPKSVLEAIDTFGYEHHWMMNVGDVKGELVDREIAKVKPKILVELGGLFGYSAIRFASQMRELSGQSVHVYSIEISPVFAATATKMVEFAGLSSFVTIFVGTFQDTHAKLQALDVDHVDVFFLDHDKKCYKSDLQGVACFVRGLWSWQITSLLHASPTIWTTSGATPSSNPSCTTRTSNIPTSRTHSRFPLTSGKKSKRRSFVP